MMRNAARAAASAAVTDFIIEPRAEEHGHPLVEHDQRRAIALLGVDADMGFSPVRAVTFQSIERTSSPGR